MSGPAFEETLERAVAWLRARYEGSEYTAAEVAVAIMVSPRTAYRALDAASARNLVTVRHLPKGPALWRAVSRS